MKKDPREPLVIVDGVRTPFARMGSVFSDLGADELGRIAVSALIAQTGLDPELVDELVFGCVGQPVDSANIARVIALRAGLPQHVPAMTVHRNCASGAEALIVAYEKMQAGQGDIFICGGTESMSQYPLLYKHSTAKKFGAMMSAKTFGQKLKAMSNFRAADFAPRVSLKLGLTDPVCGLNMGQTAELVGRENGITREMQDAFAANSHLKARDAVERLREEIAPVYVNPKFKEAVVDDNGPREDSTPEKLARLRTVFEKHTGTVTAGNASQITDGAVALLVMTESKAKELGYKPLGYLRGYANAACDPKRMGLGPVYAIHKAEQLYGFKLEDADLVEINEAFAAQVLACTSLMRNKEFCKNELGRDGIIGNLPDEKLNVNGGSIALGHPVGATGARMVLTILKELERRDKKTGLVSACVGGGQGVAVWLERA